MGGSWAGAIEIGVGEAGTCLRFSCVRQVQQIGRHGFHSRCFLACPLRRRRRRGQNRALRRHRERRRFLYLLFEQVHIQITTARQPLFVRFHRQRPD